MHFSFGSVTRLACCVLAAGLGVFTYASQSRVEASEPREAILYDERNLQGDGFSFRLTNTQPFLAVPELDPAIAKQVRSLRLGAEVGILLFRQPYFAGHDDRCGPKLGTDAQPENWWQGLTADAFGTENDNSVVSELKREDYASLILYDKRKGPPPAVMLLKRRSYYNHNCGNTLQSSYFDRMVLPVAAPPQQGQCQDLAAARNSKLTNAALSNFAKSQQLILLQPYRMNSEGPRSGSHQISIEFFDQPACQGKGMTISSASMRGEQLELSDYQLTGKIKSLRTSYIAGPWSALYRQDNKAPTPSATVVGATVADAEVVSDQQTAAAKDANEPVSSGNANAPAAKLATPTVSVIVPKTPAVTPQSSQISTTFTATTREADLAGETLQPALPPVREIPPEVRQEPKPKDKTVGANTPQPASTGSLTNVTTLIPALPTSENTQGNIITPLPSAGDQGGVQTPKVAVSIPGSAVQPLAPESQSEPSVNPVLPSGAVDEAAVVTPEPGSVITGGQTFRYPTLEGYRLNYCFDDARASCGAKAAHSWCEEKGFEKALGWREEKSIGGLFPTIVMGTDQICDRFLCDGFEEITCGS